MGSHLHFLWEVLVCHCHRSCYVESSQSSTGMKWGCAGRHLLGALHGKEVEKMRLLRMLLLSPWVA